MSISITQAAQNYQTLVATYGEDHVKSLILKEVSAAVDGEYSLREIRNEIDNAVDIFTDDNACFDALLNNSVSD